MICLLSVLTFSFCLVLSLSRKPRHVLSCIIRYTIQIIKDVLETLNSKISGQMSGENPLVSCCFLSLYYYVISYALVCLEHSVMHIECLLMNIEKDFHFETCQFINQRT